MNHLRLSFFVIALLNLSSVRPAGSAPVPGGAEFHRDIQPLLETYCYDCHGDGMSKAGVAFDGFTSDMELVGDTDLWLRALKNLRAGLMPPHKKRQPADHDKATIERWIKRSVFKIDPLNPDPGRPTIRRLNRVEYQNTVRDLIGVDFDVESAFPPDDTGHGFDNMGEVLTLPPMLLEKYLIAARTIISESVPATPLVMKEQIVPGRQFLSEVNDRGNQSRRGALSLSFYSAAGVSNTVTVPQGGKYTLEADFRISERFVDGVFDYNRCRLLFKVDGREMMQREYGWEGGRHFHYEFDVDWEAGNHELVFELLPLTPDAEQTRTLSVQIISVTIRGPAAREYWVKPRNHEQFFPREIPASPSARRSYATELLRDFAGRAFRRPADEETVNRLVDLAEETYRQEGKTFEEGISQGMVAVLASPRFIFRPERVSAVSDSGKYPFVDEYSLASRLSYFLWSSMPDEKLIRLAATGRLRDNLPGQVARMLADSRSEELVRNFSGQWLRTRDIDTVQIDARSVLAREEAFDADAERQRRRFEELLQIPDGRLSESQRRELEELRRGRRRNFRRQLRAELTPDLRRAMRRETERYFNYILREDRSLLELIDSDYTFLNELLAKHYGVADVTGEEIRRVTLPLGSARGGVLTHGSVLAVTSNPTRTSPVKRGVFILDNILGTPPPPPPPDIPALEEAAQALTNAVPALRDVLALHRKNALCSSCHNRMDPLGLAFENFNAMGMWRDTEYEQPIQASGQLITGEPFANLAELKQVLVKNHYKDFYRTVTEKLLTYALGRGLDYHDVETVDQIVARVEAAGGRPSALLAGVVESAPFQRIRPERGTARASFDKGMR